MCGHDGATCRPGTVKVTPLGSHDGEFCALDRALIFEDPDGTRILYDVGRTVRGPNDPRLGKIDAVLLSHVHGDHIGDVHQPAANAGACGRPDFSVNVTPVSNTVNVVVAKKSKLIVGAEMGSSRGEGQGAAATRSGQLSRFGVAKIGGVSVATSTGGAQQRPARGVPRQEPRRANGLTAYLGRRAVTS
jgi:hypothetical protein